VLDPIRWSSPLGNPVIKSLTGSVACLIRSAGHRHQQPRGATSSGCDIEPLIAAKAKGNQAGGQGGVLLAKKSAEAIETRQEIATRSHQEPRGQRSSASMDDSSASVLAKCWRPQAAIACRRSVHGHRLSNHGE